MRASGAFEQAKWWSEVGQRLVRLYKSQVGLGKSKIYALIAEGRFPRPYKLTPKAARWSEREVLAWIERIRAGRS